jgi:hypothetical protein
MRSPSLISLCITSTPASFGRSTTMRYCSLINSTSKLFTSSTKQENRIMIVFIGTLRTGTPRSPSLCSGSNIIKPQKSILNREPNRSRVIWIQNWTIPAQWILVKKQLLSSTCHNGNQELTHRYSRPLSRKRPSGWNTIRQSNPKMYFVFRNSVLF